jgi:hypothetical protein
MQQQLQQLLAFILWVLSIGLIIFIFGSSAGWGWRVPRWLGFLNDPDTQALLIIILVFGMIVAFITKPDKTDEDREARKGSFRQFLYDMSTNPDGNEDQE